MARARIASGAKKKINMLLYGESFMGKSTFASQAAYLKNEDGSPMKILFIDAESGSIDNYLDIMESNGVDLRNIYIVYTQSLGEVFDYIEKVKNREDFYVLDDDGNETDEVVMDADGNPFRADVLIVDGSTVLHTAAQQGLLEFSKKRARVRADKKGLVGDEKLVSIEGSSLETRDWGAISYKGANLSLSLLGTGVHTILTAREKPETVSKTIVSNGQETVVSVPTGKVIPMGFKGLEYNFHTVIRFFRNEDNEVCAYVQKDRTNVHPEETLVDPQLLDWQVLIDGNKGKKDFVLSNSLNSAVETENEIYAAEVMSNASKSLSKSEAKKIKSNENETSFDNSADSDLADIKAEITSKIKAMTPPEKAEMKKKLTDAGLPISYNKIEDTSVLNKVLEIVNA
jgi:hypothetical protein